MNDGVSLTAIGDLNWSVIQAIRTIPTILTSVPARVRHCVNPAKDQEMAPYKRVQGPLWPFPYLIPWVLKCLCYFNYNNFPVKQNFLIQRTTNLIYLTSQLFLLFCIIKKDRGIWALSWKIWPPRVGCRDHFGPQAEFSVLNTVSPTERYQPLIWRSKIWRLSLFHYPSPLTVNPKPLFPQQIDPAQINGNGLGHYMKSYMNYILSKFKIIILTWKKSLLETRLNMCKNAPDNVL